MSSSETTFGVQTKTQKLIIKTFKTTLNSTFKNVGQLGICSKINPNFKTRDMETPNHNPDTIFDEELYTIEWSDIENAEIDYENYLDDIESFFREDFENDALEENIY